MMASHKADKTQFAFSGKTAVYASSRRLVDPKKLRGGVALRGANGTYLCVRPGKSGAVWSKFLHDPLFRFVFTSPAPLRLAVTSSRHIASKDSHRHGGRRAPPAQMECLLITFTSHNAVLMRTARLVRKHLPRWLISLQLY